MIFLLFFAGDTTDLDTVLNCTSCCYNVFKHIIILSTDEDYADIYRRSHAESWNWFFNFQLSL